ncbi:AAA family ATPase [Candidatus Methanoliparum sp. LAM-1]|nr:AAA family ATPase [Candidatus Methanoliparum sp. LAM-1]
MKKKQGFVIIGITGLPASGKTEVANFIKEMGIPSINMGDVIRKEFQKMDDLENITNQRVCDIGKYADYLRKKEGMNTIAKRCIPEIEKIIDEKGDNLRYILIEGIRNIEEVELFRSLTDKFVLINVTADKNTRFERILKRGREDASEDLDERDRREIGWGLEKVMKDADIVIINDSSLTDLKYKVKEISQIFDL